MWIDKGDAVLFSGVGSWRLSLESFRYAPVSPDDSVWIEVDNAWKPTTVNVWPYDPEKMEKINASD